MRTSELLLRFIGKTELPISLKEIETAVKEISNIDKVNIYDFSNDNSNELIYGVFMRYCVTPSPYAQSLDVCDIGVFEKLDQDWKRLVITKELMHCLDNDEEKSHSVKDLNALVNHFTDFDNIQTTNTNQLAAEHNALMVAAMVLFPERARELIKPKFDNNDISINDISKLACLPEYCIEWLMSEQYDNYIDSFMSDITAA